MALNPNIILSGMPQPFDTNALLQQQISGMENINALERQRRADELAMQDRAAAAEKEAAQAQEAATLKALLPAYTYLIQTGNVAGVSSLVPPDMLETVQPYIDALAGKPPEEVKAAAIGSLSSSPMGQEALSAIQRAQTAQIQLGQLDVSRGRLAFDTEQAAAEAARGPEPSYKEVVLDDGTLMLMDTKSGKIIKPTMEGPIDTAVPPDETAGQPIKVQTEEMKQQAKERAKLDVAFPKAKRGVTSAVNALDQDIADVRQLLKDQVGLKAITGTFNAMTPDIMRDATRAAALLNKITAGAAFTALSDLKAASPMGGALGNVSNEEGRKLKESVATFDRKQTKEDFENGLLQYLFDLEMARGNVLSAFDETYSYRSDVSAEDVAEELKTRRSRIERENKPPQQPPPAGGGGGYRLLKVR